MIINQKLAEELSVAPWQTEAAVKLIDEGNTIPFISRYRKEATGSLNDEQLRNLFERLTYLRNLEEKKQTVLSAIDEQGKLTDELRQKIEAAEKLVTVEDLYRPYKQKKKTRASAAKLRGLQPLAEYILAQNAAEPIEKEAEKYVTGIITPASDSKEDKVKAAEKEVADVSAAISGAKDIIAEMISDDPDHRTYIRDITIEEGKILSTAKDPEVKSVYENYYEYQEPVEKIAGHRVLALNRGEKEKILTVKTDAPEERILRYLEKKTLINDNPFTTPCIKEAIADAYSRLISPAIEREIRHDLTEKAEDGAIDVFGKNLKQLLLQPPIAGQTVLGWDPAFRTGCKLAVVDPTGKVLDTIVIYPTEPQNKVAESKKILKNLIEKYHVTLISVGNGTASRESEQVISEFLHEIPDYHVQYVITNEAGASVYSASALASEEFPNFDVGQRSAASIARRVQDPLAELVKIDPKSIGVGQYQHDMDQKKLGEALNGVVENAVNEVGVDLNTASAALLKYISGISNTLAKNIVDYREKNGRFTNRNDLKKVPKLGPKAFQQCAGFLRITGGSEPLDGTQVHPESYSAAKKLLEKIGCEIKDEKAIKSFEISLTDKASLAEELGIGEITLVDILKELEKPGRDPREDMPKPILRSDVLSMADLKPGMVLKGTVRNVIDFGAFVDIGVHQDGLVHISEMCDRFISHPLEAVSVGDIVEVRVLSVDMEKGRISLSMKQEGAGKQESSGQGGSQVQGDRKSTRTRNSSSRRDDRNRKDSSDRRGGGNDRRNRPDKRGEGREEFAPGTIGYILAHQKK
ncbi:MAG: helix-hairpin-helix domain-containing protein [Lachnospiraceae bacterium]|nr:helix-hairpin-helix domain-containing protein [Lachnospiraceae bacterium]